MNTWTATEIERLGRADELHIAGRRTDGTLRASVIIWAVRVDGDLFVRSVNGPDAAWYRGTRVDGTGHIESGGVSKDVVFSRDTDHDAAVDAAYRAKYGTGSAVSAITGAVATGTTLRVEPAH